MGAIGYMISGEALFNPYEGGPSKVPAMSDNVSYTFTPSSGGSEQTASFIDSCNSHPTPLTAGYTWHHHGIPTCLVAQGRRRRRGRRTLIGFALDGFPIYGGRDVNGKVISVFATRRVQRHHECDARISEGRLPLRAPGRRDRHALVAELLLGDARLAVSEQLARSPPLREQDCTG